MENYLNFQPVKSLIDVSFWLHFTDLKLDQWKLTNPKVDIQGTISLPMNQQHPSNLLIDEYSLKNKKKKIIGGLLSSKVEGAFIHTNTIEEYKQLDLNKIVQEEGQKITQDQNDFDNVNRFILVSFGDLKNYNFHYKFIQLELDEQFIVSKSNKIDKFFQKKDIDQISKELQNFVQSHDNVFSFTLVNDQENQQYSITREINEDQLFNKKTYFCFYDPSPQLPSIMLKNYLVKLNRIFQEKSQLAVGETFSIKVLSIRDKISKLTDNIVLNSTFYLEIQFKKAESPKPIQVKQIDYNSIKDTVIQLKEQLDPKVISENAVDLNLKLMKWRMAPSLNLDIMQQSSCLLLGAGSLGCQVGRNLLSWGFRKVTFVDSGKVSYSNPVRQCLFTFEDSQKEDNYKSVIAAERLKQIFPSVEARGEVLNIPMPGHVVGSNEEAIQQVVNDTKKLDQLVQEHDIIFLLTDSRESRWLPTVQAALHQKICLTIALGFETFLVMRHGLNPQYHDPTQHGERLGCYFCNDVVAPRNSLQDRTLDQQCTVSRPALSCMASSIGVELLVSILNHPLKQGAKARENPSECDKTELGIIPQQIRGDLSHFGINVMYGEAFNQCIGCSQKIIDGYQSNPEEFILKATNKPDYLEVTTLTDLTGITEMIEKINIDDIECFDFDEEMQ